MSTIELNKKDLKDINKCLENIMNETKQQHLELNITLTDEDYTSIEKAMLFALKSIKIRNKEKFTPKKYRH